MLYKHSGSECSETDVNHVVNNIRSPSFGVQSSRKSGMEVSSKYMNDVKHRRWTSDLNFRTPTSWANSSVKLNKFNLKNVIKRANSLTGSKLGTSQWVLSPGRTTESLGKVEATTSSLSNLKPPTSPSKNGVEKLLNLGLDLVKSKMSSSSSSSSSRSLVRSNSGHVGVTEAGRQLRLLHNRVMQWRYANARTEIVNAKVADQAQMEERSLKCSIVQLELWKQDQTKLQQQQQQQPRPRIIPARLLI